MTVMPCAAGLSDAPAAEAVRARMDWQYALALAWTAPGVEAAVRSECRQRRLTGQAARLLCEPMLTRLRAPGLLKAQGRHRTAAPPVLAASQTLNRLEGGGETRRHARHGLATAAPDGRPAWVPAAWCDRSSQRCADSRRPPARPARAALAEPSGPDGRQVLAALYDPAPPVWLRELPALQTRRPVWWQQCDASPQDQPVRWRRAEALPPAPGLISSPDAPDARSGTKRETDGTGSKVPSTAPWDAETPHLRTAVTTTPATTADVALVPTRQAQ